MIDFVEFIASLVEYGMRVDSLIGSAIEFNYSHDYVCVHINVYVCMYIWVEVNHCKWDIDCY